MSNSKTYIDCQFRTTRDVEVTDAFCSDSEEDTSCRRNLEYKKGPKGVPTVPKYIITLTGAFGKVAHQNDIQIELLRLHPVEQNKSDWDIQSVDFITSCPSSHHPSSDVVGIKLHRVKFNTCSYRLRNTPFAIRVTFLKEIVVNGATVLRQVQVYSHSFRTLGRTPKSITTRSRNKPKKSKITKTKLRERKEDVVASFEKGLRSLLSQHPIDMKSLGFIHSIVAQELDDRSPTIQKKRTKVSGLSSVQTSVPRLGLRPQRFEPSSRPEKMLPSIGELGLGTSSAFRSPVTSSAQHFYPSDSSSSVDSESDSSLEQCYVRPFERQQPLPTTMKVVPTTQPNQYHNLGLMSVKQAGAQFSELEAIQSLQSLKRAPLALRI